MGALHVNILMSSDAMETVHVVISLSRVISEGALRVNNGDVDWFKLSLINCVADSNLAKPCAHYILSSAVNRRYGLSCCHADVVSNVWFNKQYELYRIHALSDLFWLMSGNDKRQFFCWTKFQLFMCVCYFELCGKLPQIIGKLLFKSCIITGLRSS